MPLSLSSGNLGYPSYSSQPELESSGLATSGIQIKRSSTAGPGNSHTASLIRQSTLGPPAVRKRISAVGAVSSHGRLYKVLGDFFLLAGRTEDASLWSVSFIHLVSSPRLISPKVCRSYCAVQDRAGSCMAWLRVRRDGNGFCSRRMVGWPRPGKSAIAFGERC